MTNKEFVLNRLPGCRSERIGKEWRVLGPKNSQIAIASSPQEAWHEAFRATCNRHKSELQRMA